MPTRERWQRAARAAILRSFLERGRIYSTAYFADLLESRTRSNLRGSVGALASARE